MNIYAKEGDKVIVTKKSINNGYECDKAKAQYLLEVGGIYTVDHTEVHSSCTDVYLKEFMHTSFNSVNFEDYNDDIEVKALLREALAWCLYCYTQYHVESFDLFYSQKEISFWSDKSNKRIEYYNKVSKEVMDKLYNMLIDLGIKVEEL